MSFQIFQETDKSDSTNPVEFSRYTIYFKNDMFSFFGTISKYNDIKLKSNTAILFYTYKNKQYYKYEIEKLIKTMTYNFLSRNNQIYSIDITCVNLDDKLDKIKDFLKIENDEYIDPYIFLHGSTIEFGITFFNPQYGIILHLYNNISMFDNINKVFEDFVELIREFKNTKIDSIYQYMSFVNEIIDTDEISSTYRDLKNFNTYFSDINFYDISISDSNEGFNHFVKLIKSIGAQTIKLKSSGNISVKCNTDEEFNRDFILNVDVPLITNFNLTYKGNQYPNNSPIYPYYLCYMTGYHTTRDGTKMLLVYFQMLKNHNLLKKINDTLEKNILIK